MAALVRQIDGLRLRKRRGYGTRTLIGACLVRTIYALPRWTRTVQLIEEHAGLADAIGGTPSEWACYRFMTKLREHSAALADCVDALAESLRAELPGYGVDVAIDASDLPAYANGQRFLYNHGPERQGYSDPDASWGHRSAVSTRKGGGFYGYKLHLAACTRTGLPVAWQVETARRNESLYVARLLDTLRRRDIRPETCAMDKGYDNNRVFEETRSRAVVPIVCIRKGRAIPLTAIPYGSDEWKRLHRGRAAVEREFGRLKNEYGLTPLRTRGLARVRRGRRPRGIARLGAGARSGASRSARRFATRYAPGARYWTCSALRRASIVSSTVIRTVVSIELSAPPPPIASATAAIEMLSGASHRL